MNNEDQIQALELGEFLRARRAALLPTDVGLPEAHALRRTPGLRREETAQLAAISVDYYTRLEQGRAPASASVLAALTRALRLSEDQRAYLYQLAGKPLARPARRPLQKLRPAMHRLLDQLTETPALVLGRRMDILAWNGLAAALYTDFAGITANQCNYVRLLFLDPAVRSLHVEWESAARAAVAALRMETASDPSDPGLAALVNDLSIQDRDFRVWWASHHVARTSNGVKRYSHPIVGELTLDCDVWASPDGSDQRLMVLTAEPGGPSQAALQALTSRNARARPQTG